MRSGGAGQRVGSGLRDVGQQQQAPGAGGACRFGCRAHPTCGAAPASSLHPTHAARFLTPPSMLPPSSRCRPDGQKKAYVRLTSDYDALDVANKIGVI